jgi:replicative DNA helicase
MSSVNLGNDVVSGDVLWLGEVEHRSGLYILGKPGMGKSALIVNMMNQDIENGHGVFFRTRSQGSNPWQTQVMALGVSRSASIFL